MGFIDPPHTEKNIIISASNFLRCLTLQLQFAFYSIFLLHWLSRYYFSPHSITWLVFVTDFLFTSSHRIIKYSKYSERNKIIQLHNTIISVMVMICHLFVAFLFGGEVTSHRLTASIASSSLLPQTWSVYFTLWPCIYVPIQGTLMYVKYNVHISFSS